MTSAVAAEFMPLVATAGATRHFLVVSLHDLTPSSQAICEKIIAEVARLGVRTCSLLVVPNYHHQGKSTEDRQFVSWLRGLEADGHEIVIHGYFHERQRRENETILDKLLTRFYTNDEAEFYDLDYDEAFRRIAAARDEFRACGFTPRGFVAPGWLLNPEAERAARDCEMEYTTRLSTVRDLRSGQDFHAQSIVYSVRSSWRRAMSRRWNRALSGLLKNAPLFRISIHPVDYSRPRVWRQIGRIVEMAAETRTATTYRDWIAEQRVTGT